MLSISPLPFGDVLPRSASLKDFKDGNCIFVDKTDIIYDLISRRGSFILTRPRRFGKSLLLDTIQMIFETNVIIKPLNIGKHYENLISHPVIRFDFSADSNLKDYIWNILNHHADELGISLANLGIELSTIAVVEEYSKKKGKVCILVDEYDKPIWVHDENLFQTNKDLIKNFLTTVKSLVNHVRFMLVVGETKISLSDFYQAQTT